MSAVTTDAELLAQWRAGSREAGGALIDRYFRVLHRFFRNKLHGEVGDLVQQTFLACMEGRGYEGASSFRAYLLAIARNQLFLHYRRQKRHPLAAGITPVRDLATSPSGALARHQDVRLLNHALQHVPLEAQIVLELAFWEGLDGAEIAAVLSVPLNTAYSRLRRAKAALRVALERLSPDRLDVERLMHSVEASGEARAPSLPSGGAPHE